MHAQVICIHTYFPVQSAGSEQGWVQHVRSVGGHYDLHLTKLVKAIHLVQELHQGTLDLSIG